ncbi:hypothetical protein NEF87_003400 [Candidatus Lokiarchaeum ossiferum]|uniref:N-acetyltransferase domain-containing protein n=1 Tax=Candidatus Lokiarchaeum ossiferum TaxID=2951803 RepID=A0ABY6HUB4_9ARCH|nr:hypothetical protein NEF87_003400 [Candidatus Lokiarchaeum sp. B-35]
MTFKLTKFSEINLVSLSSFIWENCLAFNRTEFTSSELILSKLLDHQSSHDASLLFSWKENNEFLGVLYLYLENSQYNIMNPGFFGQYPIIRKDLDYSLSLSNIIINLIQVLQEMHPEITSLKFELSPEHKKMPETSSIDEIMNDAGFNCVYSKLSLDLTNYTSNTINSISGLKFENYSPNLQKEFFHCYYESFMDADLAFFKNMSDEERNEMYLELLTPEYMNYAASFIVRKEKLIVGGAIIWNYSESSEKNAHLNLMCVHPHHQHQGIGQVLLDHAIQHIKHQKIPSLSLYTENDRSPYKFYTQFGFLPANGWKTFILNI